jgi:enamine deaminase RidA (YjgF/YER057c/UK114 family)
MLIEEKLRSMGLALPQLREPGGNHVRAVRVGNLLFLAGNPATGKNGPVQGKLGETITLDQAYQGAKLAALNLLSVLKAELGDLDRVKQIVRLICFVNATPQFRDLAKVSDGASDLLVAVYGDSGRHARSSIGVSSVAAGACIVIEAIVEVRKSVGRRKKRVS